MALDRLDHHAHHFRVVQHANFYGISANVFQHRIDLRTQHLRRNAVDGAYALGVLRSDGGNCRHAVATQGAEGFQIRLNTSAAAAVRASNRQHAGITGKLGRWKGVGKRHAENYAPDCCVRYAASGFGDVL